MEVQLLNEVCITATLPNLSSEQVEAVLAKLGELGVEMVSDLVEVTEEDLLSVLKPIPIRKLLAS